MADREITIKTTIDDVELWKAVWGASPDTWDWWGAFDFQNCDWDRIGTVVVTVLDPADDEWVTKPVTIDDLIAAYVKLKEMRPSIHYDDFDADTADLVLQIAVLGEVTYG